VTLSVVSRGARSVAAPRHIVVVFFITLEFLLLFVPAPGLLLLFTARLAALLVALLARLLRMALLLASLLLLARIVLIRLVLLRHVRLLRKDSTAESSVDRHE
jgi:hypothetical protein